jgi:hypothetical protein
MKSQKSSFERGRDEYEEKEVCEMGSQRCFRPLLLGAMEEEMKSERGE